MGLWKRRVGTLLVLLGLALGLVGVGIVVSPAKGQTSGDGVGVIVLALTLLVPGAVTLALGIRDRRAGERRDALLGYLRSHSRIRLADVAAYLGVPAFRAHAEIDRLIFARQVDLVFDRGSDEYLHRAAVEELHGRIVSRCPRCGAAVGEQVILPGELPLCEYCGASLADGEVA